MITFKPLFGYMAEHRITGKFLAEQIGVAPATVTKMRSTGRFTRPVIDKICSYLNIGIADVMRYEPDKERSDEDIVQGVVSAGESGEESPEAGTVGLRRI